MKWIILYFLLLAVCISSTADSDVFVTLGTAGITFEANSGDKFEFNSVQNNVDLKFHGENDLNVLYVSICLICRFGFIM